MGESVGDSSNSTKSDILIKREMIRAEFYSTYDVMTGVRIASTLGGFFLMMVLLVLYKSKCKTRSLSDQHLEAVIKAAVDQEEQLVALAKRSSSSSYCSGHGICRCSRRYSIPENTSTVDFNNWNRKSRAYLSETQYHSYTAANQIRNDRFMKSPVLEYSFEEDEDEEMEDLRRTNGYRIAKWLEVPDEKNVISRGNSAITVSSNDTSYLEARGSSLVVGHPPSPLNHPSSTRDPPWEFYYPIDIQVIQPTPCLTPSGSQDSFSDVPRHTQQLLPAGSGRRRARDPLTSAAAPIASIRTSCSSCSEDDTSTGTTVNSSVFADDCTNCTSPLLPGGGDCVVCGLDEMPSESSALLGRSRGYTNPRRRLSSPTAGNRTGRGHAAGRRPSDDMDGTRPSFRDFHRTPSAATSNTVTAGKNVIFVQADVNPIADTIVNANSLSGSLRALYDASKETLF